MVRVDKAGLGGVRQGEVGLGGVRHEARPVTSALIEYTSLLNGYCLFKISCDDSDNGWGG